MGIQHQRTIAGLSSTFAPASLALKVAPAPGRKIAFAGDSHAAGTGTSVSNRRFSVVAPMLAGTRWFSRNPLQAGVAGNTSAQLLARIEADAHRTPGPPDEGVQGHDVVRERGRSYPGPGVVGADLNVDVLDRSICEHVGLDAGKELG